ncbi:thioesterase II family protein [Chryseobacterium sp. G0201]|uniref:thioesterase II family protein n=1 Tax=Chryseobacterium sp. G0201 TaxID=2487065 RepID=UPI000F4FC84E|nr:alpha/beta fold hydrolase [Chryseobacterium sp. G0201]AZA53941.1 alpha/beta fold hydrolase [Chryseobacterium sp. G0201]
MEGKILLFCIPHAGGSASSLSNVTYGLNVENIQVHHIELPGRGMRSEEPFHSTLEETIEDISEKIRSKILCKNQPFILWGHSMGAILALLLSYNLQDHYTSKGLIVSGMRAPLFQSAEQAMSRQKRNALMSDILPTKYERNKNTPLFQRVQHKRLQVMEKDIALLAQNPIDDWPSIIVKTPLAIIMAENDELYNNKDSYKDWNLHTSNTTSYFSIEGGHFFMFQYPKQTSALLNKIINDLTH